MLCIREKSEQTLQKCSIPNTAFPIAKKRRYIREVLKNARNAGNMQIRRRDSICSALPLSTAPRQCISENLPRLVFHLLVLFVFANAETTDEGILVIFPTFVYNFFPDLSPLAEAPYLFRHYSSIF